jgi:hypothetical protein
MVSKCLCARLSLRTGPSSGCGSRQRSSSILMYTQKVSDEPNQKTPKGEEIPVPTREDVLRDLKKLAKAKPSTARRPKK